MTITYRLRIGVGALQGDGINRADAASGEVRSNTARARVLVSGGVFTTDACVVGTIFADRNGNGLQDPGEPGVPDVHLNFEEGTTLVSDVEGKYSYCGLTPTTHVLHVDRTTLPAGSELTTSSNRNAGDAGSLFVDLKSGEVHRADFIVDAAREPGRARGDWRPAGARRSLGAVVRRAGAAGDHRWPAGDRERRQVPRGCGRCADATGAGPDGRRIRTDPAGGRPQPGELECTGAVAG